MSEFYGRIAAHDGFAQGTVPSQRHWRNFSDGAPSGSAAKLAAMSGRP